MNNQNKHIPLPQQQQQRSSQQQQQPFLDQIVGNNEICPIHNQVFIKVCYTDTLALCKICIQEHSNHTIIDPSQQVSYIKNKCIEMEPELRKYKEQLKDVNLPKSEQFYNEKIAQLQEAKQQLYDMIEGYFSDLINTFTHLCFNFPSDESKNRLLQKINDIFDTFNTTKRKADEGQLKALDVSYFLHSNFPEVLERINTQVRIMQKASNNDILRSNSKQNPTVNGKSQIDSPIQFPYFKISQQILEKVMFDLMNYVTPVFPGTQPRQQFDKISITPPQFHPSRNITNVGIIDDKNSTFLYHELTTQENKRNIIPVIPKNQNSKLPYQSSFVALPDNTIFFSGGVDNDGRILNSSLIFNLNDNSVQLKRPMRVKKCGHSLIYVPNTETGMQASRSNSQQQAVIQNQGYGQYEMENEQQGVNPQQNELNRSASGFIYCIGGRTNQNTRTKLCEKYNIEKDVWVPIKPLQAARSRSGCCLVDNQYIYSFYGVNSFQKSVTSIERDFDLCHFGAVQINSDQILIFGGFRDSIFFDNHFLFNKKLFAYNISSESISLYDDTLPSDFIVQGQPIIYQDSVYAVGQTMEELGNMPKMNLNQFTVVKISKEGTKIVAQLQHLKAFPTNQGGGNIQNQINGSNQNLDFRNSINRQSLQHQQQQFLQPQNQSVQSSMLQGASNNSFFVKQSPYSFNRNSNIK